ncbi:MAG: hypothetical protein A3H27_11605 [Acidobacteria bacterium RIFCSPLOWO2_02_FULL_59_13]|nr:MAG: hypothetical protein A3H27_11605 [Acidobacteria bacterium RIFCSPLOWO2_02_FULL_59_13]OGA81343.1 MAG: hypothetical protein A3G27_01400 [Betaproteobacteria bacterium RIFCSPLOWO2_12_FULL_66_14]
MKTVIYAVSAFLAISSQASAQKQDNNSADWPASLCDRLAGAAHEQCVRDERPRADTPAQGRDLVGSCDTLIGPEKEQCLRQGGTVEAGARSSGGATRPPTVPR